MDLNKLASAAKEKLSEGYGDEYYDNSEEGAKRENINLEEVDYDDYEAEEGYYDDRELGSLDEIYPYGPTTAKVDMWKKEHPDCNVFSIEIAGDKFTCRTLTRLEYKKLNVLDIDQLQREEVVCATCILHPEGFTWKEINQLRAGVPSTLAAAIMEESGFTQQYGIEIL